MTSYLLDTNVILRFLLKDDLPLFNRANQIFTDAENGNFTLVIDPVIVAECIWVMTSVYSIKRAAITDKIRQLISQDWIISTSKPGIIQSLELFSQTNYSYIDCWLAVQSQVQSLALKTFDTKLQKLAQSLT